MKNNIENSATPTVRYANPGIAREMSTASLNSGQPYQRPVKPYDVDNLIKRWNPAYLTPIEVSFRDGVYNVINGQHRIEAMRKMNGGRDVMVQCLIYTGLTYEQEAAMYYLLDKSTGRLKLANAIRALLESGTDPAIIDIKRRIERAGFTWALDKPTGVTYEIKPVRAIIDAYGKLGALSFSRMLGLMAGAWHGTQVSLKSDMISGMALFLKAHEQELDDYAAIQRLSAVDPAEIIQLAKVDSPPLRYARLIREQYNEHASGDELPYRFSK